MSKPKLLEQVREAIRQRRFSRRTEEAYVEWTRRFVLFHGKRHPSKMGAGEIRSGLRLLEGLRLRVKDVQFSQLQITVREGKGRKDRITMLPDRLKEPLERHLRTVKLHSLALPN